MKKIIRDLLVLAIVLDICYFFYTMPSSNNNKIINNGNGTITVVEYALSGDSISKIYKSDEVHKGLIVESSNLLSHSNVTIKCNGKKYYDRVYNDECTLKPKKGDTVKIVKKYYPVCRTEIIYK